jgi:uncharacterized protein (DUF427 family)
MKEPGPDHPIAIEPTGKRVRVIFAGKVIADTKRALTLRETTYPPMHYIPREDVDMTVLKPTDHRTYCPYKGNASYFSIEADGRGAENAVWSYQEPYPAVRNIGAHLCFYPNRVDAIEEVAE